MHIWNGCNVLNIVGNPMKAINVNLSFLSFGWKVVEWTPQDWKNFWIYFWGQDQKLWNGPPRLEKFFNFISEFRIKSCGMDPPCWHLMEILENLLFHVLSNDACKFAINLFPITWGPFENVNLLYRWVPLKLDFLGAWKSVWLKHYPVYPIIIISLIIQRNLVTKIRAKWNLA